MSAADETYFRGPERVEPEPDGLPFRTAREVAELTPAVVPWLVKPWVAQGCVTLLDGKVKCGKSTFLGAVVRRVLDGGDFLGEPTTWSKVVWLTEQPPSSFRELLRRCDLLERDDLLILFWADTRGKSWEEVAEAAIAKARDFGAAFLVVDTLSQFAGLRGNAENDAGDALYALRPLQGAAAGSKLGVVIARHERKSGGEVGDAGRGSSAVSGGADIVLSLRRPEGAHRPTVRLLQALSRFEETPPELVIELEAGRYRALGTSRDLAHQEARSALLETLSGSAENAATVAALRGRLPELRRTTLLHALEGMRASGLVAVAGRGKRGDPLRYYLRGGDDA